MMLAANRYVTRNGTFEPYHATITRIYRRVMDERGMADVSYPRHITPDQSHSRIIEPRTVKFVRTAAYPPWPQAPEPGASSCARGVL